MHYWTHQNDVSLAKQFQKHLYKEHRKYGFIDQGKYRKRASKIKWMDKEYHVQDNADVAKKVWTFIVNQPMYLPTVSFRVLPSYVLWAHFIRWEQKICCHYYCTHQTFDWTVKRTKITDVNIKYIMGKYWWLCRAI